MMMWGGWMTNLPTERQPCFAAPERPFVTPPERTSAPRVGRLQEDAMKDTGGHDAQRSVFNLMRRQPTEAERQLILRSPLSQRR
jgi:hypothetical protein